MEDMNILRENLDNNNLEIEKSIISAVLNNHKEINDIFLSLLTIDFDNPNNRLIYASILKLKDEGKIIDSLSVISYIKNNQDYIFNNYEEYILELSSMYNYENSLKGYIEILKIASISRQLKEFGKSLQDISLDSINWKDEIWKLEKNFMEITNSRNAKEVESMEEIVFNYQQKLEQLKNRSEELTGCPSGYSNIDKITNGFQPGDLIILAARPGIGKTAISLNFMLNAAKEYLVFNKTKQPNEKEKVLLMFSMEMGNNQICERLVSIDSTVDISITKRGTWDALQWNSIQDSIARLSSFPIYVDDSSGLSILDLQTKVKQLSSTKDIKLIVVDYLQLLKGPKGASNVNRQQEVANISRTLKSIARQYNVPVIAIAQLSRKIEERRGEAKRPILSDLRESGAIEQDADIVAFLNYKDAEGYDNSTLGSSVMVEYIIQKHRNGSTGIVELLFDKSTGRYLEVK